MTKWMNHNSFLFNWFYSIISFFLKIIVLGILDLSLWQDSLDMKGREMGNNIEQKAASRNQTSSRCVEYWASVGYMVARSTRRATQVPL